MVRQLAVMAVDILSWTICKGIDWVYETNWTDGGDDE